MLYQLAMHQSVLYHIKGSLSLHLFGQGDYFDTFNRPQLWSWIHWLPQSTTGAAAAPPPAGTSLRGYVPRFHSMHHTVLLFILIIWCQTWLFIIVWCIEHDQEADTYIPHALHPDPMFHCPPAPCRVLKWKQPWQGLTVKQLSFPDSMHRQT